VCTFQFGNNTWKNLKKEDYGKPHKIPQSLKPYIVAWTNHLKHKLHNIIGNSTIGSNSKQPKELWNSNKSYLKVTSLLLLFLEGLRWI
jgi:hypothetical protein